MKIIKAVLRWGNILLVVITIISYFASYVNPQTIWWASLLGMGFPLLLIGNTLALILFAFLRMRTAWLNALCLLFGVFSFQKMVAFSSTANTTKRDSTFTIVTYNPNFFQGHPSTPRLSDDEFIDVYLQELQLLEGDIICFQEGTRLLDQGKKGEIKLAETLDLPYNHSWSGVRIYSKYPILNKEVVMTNKSNAAIFADIKLGAAIFRVYNVHFASIGISPVLQKVSDEGDLQSEETKSDIVSIVKAMKLAAIERGRQVEIVKKHMAGSPYPIIVCGDFNDTPFSYTYNQMSEGLQDSFVEKGDGLGITYNGPIPGLRIDFILAHPTFSIMTHQVHPFLLSDHYAVSSTIRY